MNILPHTSMLAPRYYYLLRHVHFYPCLLYSNVNSSSLRPYTSLSSSSRSWQRWCTATAGGGWCLLSCWSLEATQRGGPSGYEQHQQHRSNSTTTTPREKQYNQKRRDQQFLSVNDLLDDYVKNRNHFKPHQVGFVWNKLGKAVQQTRNKRELRNFWSDHEAYLRTLVAHTMQIVNEFDGRATATVTHSLAKLCYLTDDLNLGRIQSLWNDLILRTAMHVKSDRLNAQDVSNLLWAYAKVDKGKTNKRLLDALANKAMLRINEFNPQDLSNTVLAFAMMNYKVPSLLDVVARTAQERVDNFNQQDLANTAWAFATLNHNAPSLFDAIAKAAQVCIDDFMPQALANTAWAFATLKHKALPLFDAIAKAGKERIDDFDPQALSNTAWAFATLKHKAPPLFDAIAKAGQECIYDFKPQELSNTAWAFATLNQKAPLLFDAIALAAQKRIDDFNPQALSNMAWAFATLNQEAPSLFDAIAKRAHE